MIARAVYREEMVLDIFDLRKRPQIRWPQSTRPRGLEEPDALRMLFWRTSLHHIVFEVECSITIEANQI